MRGGGSGVHNWQYFAQDIFHFFILQGKLKHSIHEFILDNKIKS